jgi:hypothetical protein
MPLTYSIDDTRQIVLEVWTGDVTARMVGSLWKKYLADPRVMAIRRTLADLRECNLLLTGQDLSKLVETVAVPGLKGRDWHTAILVARPDQYGFSRQFHVFSHIYNKNQIFYEWDEALRWIVDQKVHEPPP